MARTGRLTRATGEDFVPDLTIVIPSYNEGHRIESGLARLKAAAIRGALDLETTEIIWVDDGSTDDTVAVATRFAGALPHARVLEREHNSGKGAAVRSGVAAATGSTIIFCDADMSIDPSAIPDFQAALATCDVAIGSRAIGRQSIEYGNPVRTLGGRFFNRIVTRSTGLALRDTQCGFKGFTGPAARLLFATGAIERFAFDVELLMRARQFGLQVAEIPVTWDAIEGSHIRPIADPASMLADLARSKFGLRVAPPVGALEVLEPTDLDALQARIANVAPTPAPVVVQAQGFPIVLFPFLDGGKLATVRAHVRAAINPLPVRERHLSAKDLAELAPLSLAHQR